VSVGNEIEPYCIADVASSSYFLPKVTDGSEIEIPIIDYRWQCRKMNLLKKM